MLVRDLQMRPTAANGSGRSRLVIGVINLQLGEIGMYFPVSRSRVHLKTHLARQRDFNIALSILNLYISRRTSPETPSRRISLARVVRRNGPANELARRSPESRSRSPSSLANSMSVRADLKLTVLATFESLTLSMNSPLSRTAPFTSESVTSFARPSIETSPETCDNFTELCSRFRALLPLMSSIVTSPC